MRIFENKVSGRTICYLDIMDSLEEFRLTNLENWVLLVIEDDKDNPILASFAEVCIDKELLYMGAVGVAGSQVDDLFDYAMIIREMQGGMLPYWVRSSEDVLMTVWDENLSDGFWFITHAAYYEDFPITTVLVANLTARNYEREIEELIVRFS